MKKPGEVLAEVPGLSRNDLIIWDRQGYITPHTTKRGKVFRRSYSDEDVKLIKLIKEYHDRGYPPRAAYDKAQQQLKSGQTAPKTLRDMMMENDDLVNKEFLDRNLRGRVQKSYGLDDSSKSRFYLPLKLDDFSDDIIYALK